MIFRNSFYKRAIPPGLVILNNFLTPEASYVYNKAKANITTPEVSNMY
jgi:hypothetical protein